MSSRTLSKVILKYLSQISTQLVYDRSHIALSEPNTNVRMKTVTFEISKESS